MYYANEIIDRIRSSRCFAIFGAGIVAGEVVRCLTEEPYQFAIKCCIVSDTGDNPGQVAGVPVISLNEAKERLPDDALIGIACIEKLYHGIYSAVIKAGFTNILRLSFDSDIWCDLRGNYIRHQFELEGRKYFICEEELKKQAEKTKDNKQAVIYTIHSHMDQKLEESTEKYHFEVPIQVGAALTNQSICEIKDDIGDNISDKNLRYCELTGLYWIWKHAEAEYLGMCHYRRHFELSEEQIILLGYSDIDVVLTIPILNFPDVETVYAKDHLKEDWMIMEQAVEELAPGYVETLQRLKKGNYYYAYNMFLARREILNQYCSWLFPILSYCETHCKKHSGGYQGRYIGFLSERLMSLYFMHHENDYKEVHCRKHFIG